MYKIYDVNHTPEYSDIYIQKYIQRDINRERKTTNG